MSKKIIALAFIPAIGLALFGASSANAFGGQGSGRGMGQFDSFRGNGNGFLTQEERADFRGDCMSPSDEERQARWEERQAFRNEQRTEVENFTGLTRDEIRDMHRNGGSIGDALAQNGVTKESAQAFLTEQANERVDAIVENHDLTSAQEQTLRDRVSSFVSRILDRWF